MVWIRELSQDVHPSLCRSPASEVHDGYDDYNMTSYVQEQSVDESKKEEPEGRYLKGVRKLLAILG